MKKIKEMISKQEKQIFVFDQQTILTEAKAKLKYIVKNYNMDGSINYFEIGDQHDAFHELLEQLEKEKAAEIFISLNRLQPAIEFLNELNYSIKNAKLTFKFMYKKSWRQVTYYF